MFDEVRGKDVFSMTEAIESLRELESCTSRSIVQRRASERIELQTKVMIRPANASQRHQMVIDGLSADISNGGCMILLPRPVMAGDVYWLTFDNTHIRVGSRYALCLRCRRVQEEAFEAGFRFFDRLDLASAMVQRHQE